MAYLFLCSLLLWSLLRLRRNNLLWLLRLGSRLFLWLRRLRSGWILRRLWCSCTVGCLRSVCNFQSGLWFLDRVGALRCLFLIVSKGANLCDGRKPTDASSPSRVLRFFVVFLGFSATIISFSSPSDSGSMVISAISTSSSPPRASESDFLGLGLIMSFFAALASSFAAALASASAAIAAARSAFSVSKFRS